MRRCLLMAAVVLGAASCASSYTAGVSSGGFGVAATTPDRRTQGPTTVYVVRHAEAEQDGTRDPALTSAGESRAEALRAALAGAGIVAIYSSPYRRTRATAMPLAVALGLRVREYDPRDAGALVTRIRREHPGRSVLVVGHSNTVPMVVEALGAARPPDLAHAEHDPVFIVRVSDRNVETAGLRYGAPNDTAGVH